MSYGYKRLKYECIIPNDDPKLDAGETVYEFTGNDYGIVRDDEAILKEPCIAITRDESGSNPFIVVPKRCVKEID